MCVCDGETQFTFILNLLDRGSSSAGKLAHLVYDLLNTHV